MEMNDGRMTWVKRAEELRISWGWYFEIGGAVTDRSRQKEEGIVDIRVGPTVCKDSMKQTHKLYEKNEHFFKYFSKWYI